MRFALIQGGVVVNIILADDAFINTIKSQYDSIVNVTNASPSPGLGWTKNGNTFSPPEGPAT